MPKAVGHSPRYAVVMAGVVAIATFARAEDVSQPAMLQWFETSWSTMESRTADVFAAGYGGLWVPPPGLATSGAASVGYDPYDRFNLGTPEAPTRYGTQAGFQAAIAQMHAAGLNVYADLVWNHNGTSTTSTKDGNGNSFPAAGGYPGFALTLQTTDPTKPGYNTLGYNDVDGDFHGAYDTGDQKERLAGLIDIAQEKNYQFIRNPVAAGDPRNLPAGTVTSNGRLANVPTASNGQFYEDKDLGGTTVYDPKAKQNVTIYDFNTANPMAGDAVAENAQQYLMRQARWMVQVVGVDGFRIDAAKNMPASVLNAYDDAVYNASTRTNLDGTRKQVFGFSEVYSGDAGTVQSSIRKDTASTPSGQISGNRDALDFPLFFAMRTNLSNNGVTNDWRNVKNASIDANDDGYANNGSQGVSFVSSADDDGAYLDNVAYAYTLMRPGNAIVYDNGHAVSGTAFPQDGRGDALGGQYGSKITTLLDIRNTHGRGNYIDRTPNAGTDPNSPDAKTMLIYERSDSALVVLSNRIDSGYDSRTVQTNFKPGTPLVELTGNAASSTVDPTGIFPDVVVVNGDGTVNLKVPRNMNANGVETDKGYFIYGPSGPQGTLSLTNVASTLAGATPTAANNGTARLANINVVSANTFDVTLRTNKVTLAGNIRDHDADGDNALISIDNAVDANGNGQVDNRTAGTVNYGFDKILTVNTPGYSSPDNTGTYTQTVDTSKLSEGYHYLDVRAFRHRDSGEPEIFSDFKQTIYVDRLPPVSAVASFNQGSGTSSQTRDLRVRSVDGTATSENVFLDLPASLTDAQVLAMVGTANAAGAYDKNLFTYRYTGVGSGNHVATIVTREVTGNYSVQRLLLGNVSTTKGAGLGDLNFDGTYAAGDVAGTSYGMQALVYPNANGQTNTQFNAAADLNGDGLIDSRDLYAMRDRFVSVNAPADARAATVAAVLKRGDVNGDGHTDAADVDAEYAHLGNTAWTYDLDASGWPTPDGANQADVDTLVHTIFQTQYGDANLDGRVTIADFNALAADFNQPGTWASGDFNGDGRITIADFNLLAANFNFATATPAELAAFGDFAAGVPEPAALALCGPATLLLARRARRRSLASS